MSGFTGQFKRKEKGSKHLTPEKIRKMRSVGLKDYQNQIESARSELESLNQSIIKSGEDLKNKKKEYSDYVDQEMKRISEHSQKEYEKVLKVKDELQDIQKSIDKKNADLDKKSEKVSKDVERLIAREEKVSVREFNVRDKEDSVDIKIKKSEKLIEDSKEKLREVQTFEGRKKHDLSQIADKLREANLVKKESEEALKKLEGREERALEAEEKAKVAVSEANEKLKDVEKFQRDMEEFKAAKANFEAYQIDMENYRKSLEEKDLEQKVRDKYIENKKAELTRRYKIVTDLEKKQGGS